MTISQLILFKFRSAKDFEEVLVPGGGTFVRIFDIKRAIVKAKKLDSGRPMEFDLLLSDHETGEEYTDETTMVIRGPRFLVQRLPASKGQGLVERIARGAIGESISKTTGVVPQNFYTIQSREREQDEFATELSEVDKEETEELLALRAVTESAANEVQNPIRDVGKYTARRRNPQQSFYSVRKVKSSKIWLDPDPEIREHEKDDLPKKRIVGIPHRFRNVAAGSIEPNLLEFEKLKSLTTTTCSKKTAIKSAMVVTNTTIPEYLQCSVCQELVDKPICVHWDDSVGRTACQQCMRAAIVRDFRCPITGTEGISPGDLHLNKPLECAAVAFAKQVLAKMSELEKEHTTTTGGTSGTAAVEPCPSDSDNDKKQQGEGNVCKEDNGLMGMGKDVTDEEDEFGGDVFAPELAREEGKVSADVKSSTVDQKGTAVKLEKQLQAKKGLRVHNQPVPNGQNTERKPQLATGLKTLSHSHSISIRRQMQSRYPNINRTQNQVICNMQVNGRLPETRPYKIHAGKHSKERTYNNSPERKRSRQNDSSRTP